MKKIGLICGFALFGQSAYAAISTYESRQIISQMSDQEAEEFGKALGLQPAMSDRKEPRLPTGLTFIAEVRGRALGGAGVGAYTYTGTIVADLKVLQPNYVRGPLTVDFKGAEARFLNFSLLGVPPRPIGVPGVGGMVRDFNLGAGRDLRISCQIYPRDPARDSCNLTLNPNR